jgi:L-iditol 2-dehydrogenase
MMRALTYEASAPRWIACKLAGRFRPGVFWSRIAPLRMRTVPVPELPSPRWVRLRPILGGICGTDLAAIMLRHHPASILQTLSSFPAILGHENVCVIDEVGAEVEGWQPGDRVVVEPSLSCAVREIVPLCEACREGRFTLCRNFRNGSLPNGSMIGWNNFTGGTWAPYCVAHQTQLHRVPDAINDTQAVLTDPFAGALHAVLAHRPTDDETVLVLGAGVVGMGVAASIRALGSRCRLLAIARHGRQGELLRRFGADEIIEMARGESQSVRYGKLAERVGGRVVPSKFGHHALVGGVDRVYDCVGSGQSLTDAMKYARAGGVVVEVGTSQIALVDTTPLWLEEQTLVGANGRAIENFQGRSMHTYQIVFEMLATGRLDFAGLLTHRFKLSDYGRALWTMANRHRTGAIKVAFEADPADR